MLGLSTKKRKAKFNTDDLTFRKTFNLSSGTPLYAERSSTEQSSTEHNSAESLTNKYKLFWTKSKQTVNFLNISETPFPLTSSEKYILIEEFKDRIKGLKNLLKQPPSSFTLI